MVQLGSGASYSASIEEARSHFTIHPIKSDPKLAQRFSRYWMFPCWPRVTRVHYWKPCIMWTEQTYTSQSRNDSISWEAIRSLMKSHSIEFLQLGINSSSSRRRNHAEVRLCQYSTRTENSHQNECLVRTRVGLGHENPRCPSRNSVVLLSTKFCYGAPQLRLCNQWPHRIVHDGG
jgi:hypothetical protein